MRRLPLTLTLTALTALTLTTAALAAPPGPDTVDCPVADDPTMAAMHADPEAMLAMHDRMAVGLDHDEMHADCPMTGGAMHHGEGMPHGDVSSHEDHHR